MNTYKKLLYIFNRKQKINLILLSIIILISTALELVGVAAIFPFVNIVMDPDSIFENPLLNMVYTVVNPDTVTQFLIYMAVGLIVVYIIKNIFIAFMYDCQYRFVFNNQKRLACRLMKCYIKQPYLFHVEHNSADIIRNVNDDVSMFFGAVLACVQLATEASVCVALCVYLFATDVTITITVAVLLGGCLLIFFRKFKSKFAMYGKKTRSARSASNKWLLQGLGGIKEIIVLERESFFIDNFSVAYDKYAHNLRKRSLSAVLPKPIMEVVCIGGILMAVVLKLASGTDINTFVPTLSVFAIAAFRMLPSMNRISTYISSVIYNIPAVDAVYKDLKEIEKLEIENIKGIEQRLDFEDEIRIEHLSFRYPRTQEDVIHDVSFVIPKNKSVAFVGPSGAGKTTLVDLLLGVLQPSNGHVWVGNQDIYENLSQWHSMIGYIPQTIYLTDDTLRNNIAFGIEPDAINEEQIWKALEDAQLKDFVLSLENGLDTVVGETGVRLSGGQRQRIGIARALYHNPEILVLDEATSALDGETETAVMEAIDALAGSKTMLIIAHRLSTIENCDYTYKVQNGNVVCVEK